MAVAVAQRDRFWTYDDLRELPDDGRRWEIVEGALVEMTGPSTAHGRVMRNLLTHLVPVLNRAAADWYAAPLDVVLPDGSVVEPDLFAILPGGSARTTPRAVTGAPDLVVEVVSPSNRRHDTVTKRALYEKAGVREYWLVDPEARTVEILVLGGGTLHLRQRCAGADVVASPLLPEVAFRAAEAFTGLDEIARDGGAEGA